MARPRKPIDWDDVAKLAALHCTQEEIASFCEVSKDTLERHCEEATGLSFAAFYAQKKDTGKISIRRKQYEVAMKGNPTLLIWWGKQNLAQSEKQEVKTEITTTAQPKTQEELVAFIEASRTPKKEGE